MSKSKLSNSIWVRPTKHHWNGCRIWSETLVSVLTCHVFNSLLKSTFFSFIYPPGILNTEPYVPEAIKLPPKKAQERGRGRGRGKVINDSLNESVRFNRDRGNQSTGSNSDSDAIHSPEYAKLITPSKRVCTPKTERWATLAPDTFNEVEIGIFYSPARFYVCLVSKRRRCDRSFYEFLTIRLD